MQLPLIKTAEDFEQHFRDKFWQEIGESVCRRHGVSFGNLRRAERGENVVFLIDERLILKFFTPFKNDFRREKIALECARGKSFIRAFAG